jgi:hypothetical protein
MVNKGRALHRKHSPDDGDSLCRTVCPFRVIRDRVETAASRAMPAMPPKAEVSYPAATQQERTR